jgi:hypothetical protein
MGPDVIDVPFARACRLVTVIEGCARATAARVAAAPVAADAAATSFHLLRTCRSTPLLGESSRSLRNRTPLSVGVN